MANDDDGSAPWTIKSVPVRVREKAVRYARMEGLTMAEWLGRAVETEANRQDGNTILPPAPSAAVAVAVPPVSGVPLGEVAHALQALAAAAGAGLPVTKAAARETVALMREQMRAARGLPPRAVRRTGGQTARRIGQTVSSDLGVPNGHAAE